MCQEDLKRLADTLSHFDNEQEFDRIVEIIDKGNPEVEVNIGVRIDLNLLTAQTLSALKDFSRKELSL
jgi:hypothetical protein